MKDLAFAFCGKGKEIAELYSEKFPKERKEILFDADKILENIFVFTDKWEMERSTEEIKFEKIDWQYKPHDDPEWTFAFNRHSFLLKLAKAYVLSGDEKYAEHYLKLILDFIENSPLNDENRKTSWRGIEVGLRAENWLKSLLLIKESKALTDENLQKIENTLKIHAEELCVCHDDFKRLSNWGVLQDFGLFLLGIYFNNTDYVNLTLERLNDNINLQILKDGVHWEQSPLYHCEVFHCLLSVVQVAQRCEINLPIGFSDSVKNMAHALTALSKPDGHIIMQSDSDDIDARDLIANAAVIFNEEIFKFYSDNHNFCENLWDMGVEAGQKFFSLSAKNIKPESLALQYSGNYFLRAANNQKKGDSRKENYLHFHCGSLGSGHGHADLLHIDLFAYGEDILIDSGRYTYVDNEIRLKLKSPAAHNTITVNNKDFSICENSWGYSKQATNLKGEYCFSENADFISGGHLGYLEDSVLLFRKIVYIKPDIYLIFDIAYAKGVNKYTRYFHFNNKGKLSQKENEFRYCGEKAQAKLISLGEAKSSIITAPLSRHYNELEYGKCLVLESEHNGFAGMVSLISVAEADSDLHLSAKLISVKNKRTGELLQVSQAQAVEITRNDEKFTVICLHEDLISEVSLFEAGDCIGYGKILVSIPNEKNPITLSW